MLYPGYRSLNITPMSGAERLQLIPPGKQLSIIVIDGTWATARKMVNLSQNLKSLPRICFTPTGPSNFRVRRQPRPECHSTVEAIHHTLQLFGEKVDDRLLQIFNRIVDRQIALVGDVRNRRRGRP